MAPTLGGSAVQDPSGYVRLTSNTAAAQTGSAVYSVIAGECFYLRLQVYFVSSASSGSTLTIGWGNITMRLVQGTSSSIITLLQGATTLGSYTTASALAYNNWHTLGLRTKANKVSVVLNNALCLQASNVTTTFDSSPNFTITAVCTAGSYCETRINNFAIEPTWYVANSLETPGAIKCKQLYTNKVGIGAAPTYALDVGQFRFFTGSITGYYESLRIDASGRVGVGVATPTATLQIHSSSQNQPRLILSGQEFWQSNNTSTDGIAFLAGLNRTNNRQLWVADSATLVVNSTNTVLRLIPSSGVIDAIATDGATIRSLKLGYFEAASGCKLTVQNGQDGGPTRGIMMWTSGDTNWGIYMGTASSTNSLAGGVATGGTGFTSHAIRFRVYNGTTHGWIFENSSEGLAASISADGLAYFASKLGSGVNPNYPLHVAGDGVVTGNFAVGLNSTNTSYSLDVVGTGRFSSSTCLGDCGHGYYYAAFAHASAFNTSSYALLSASVGDTYLNCGNGKTLYFREGNNTKFYYSGSQLSLSNCWLWVGAYAQMNRGGYQYLAPSGTGWNNGGVNQNYSIMAEQRIQASEFNATSDRRQKTDISSVQPTRCGDILRQLQVKTFIKNQEPTHVKFGLIAPEVEAVFPNAVVHGADCMFEIQEQSPLIDVSGDSKEVTIAVTEKNQQLKTDDIVHVQQGSTAGTATVVAVTDGNLKLRAQHALDKDAELLVAGSYVNDLRSLDVTVSPVEKLHEGIKEQRHKSYRLTYYVWFTRAECAVTVRFG
eukprot:jgi/Chrzof1/2802/UNPLg00716.t1